MGSLNGFEYCGGVGSVDSVLLSYLSLNVNTHLWTRKNGGGRTPVYNDSLLASRDGRFESVIGFDLESLWSIKVCLAIRPCGQSLLSLQRSRSKAKRIHDDLRSFSKFNWHFESVEVWSEFNIKSSETKLPFASVAACVWRRSKHLPLILPW